MDTLFAVGQHGKHRVAVVFGLKKIEPGMQGTVGVPKRKDGEVGEALGAVHVSVEAAVLTVYVLEDMRCNQAVVERGVEGGFILGGQKGALDFLEFGEPAGLGLGFCRFKGLGFCAQVGQGAGGRNAADGKDDLQGDFVGSKGEFGPNRFSRHFREVVELLEASVEAAVGRLVVLSVPVASNGLVKRSRKVDVAVARPTGHMPVARNQRVVFHAETGPKNLPVVAVDAIHQVEQKGSAIRSGEGVAVESRVGAGAEFGQRARTLQPHPVIARLRGLRLLVEGFKVARGGILSIAR